MLSVFFDDRRSSSSWRTGGNAEEPVEAAGDALIDSGDSAMRARRAEEGDEDDGQHASERRE